MTEEDDGDEEEGEDEVREEGVKVAAVDGKCDLDGSVENIIATIQANFFLKSSSTDTTTTTTSGCPVSYKPSAKSIIMANQYGHGTLPCISI